MDIIELKNGRHSTYPLRHYLYNQGFTYDKTKNSWIKKVTHNEFIINEWKRFAKEEKLIFLVYPETLMRSTDYRRQFFENFKPQWKDKYICAYCGKKLNPEETTIDHIIPVKKAQRNKFAQYILKKQNITNVNDLKNLAPACMTCNFKKGSKLGFYWLLGHLGKNKYFWYTVYFLVYASVMGCLFFTIYLYLYLVQ